MVNFKRLFLIPLCTIFLNIVYAQTDSLKLDILDSTIITSPEFYELHVTIIDVNTINPNVSLLGLGFNGVVKKIHANVELKYDASNTNSRKNFPNLYFNNTISPLYYKAGLSLGIALKQRLKPGIVFLPLYYGKKSIRLIKTTNNINHTDLLNFGINNEVFIDPMQYKSPKLTVSPQTGNQSYYFFGYAINRLWYANIGYSHVKKGYYKYTLPKYGVKQKDFYTIYTINALVLMRIKYENQYQQYQDYNNGEKKWFEMSLNESPRNYFGFQAGIRHISVSGVGGTYGLGLSYLPGIKSDVFRNTTFQFQIGFSLSKLLTH